MEQNHNILINPIFTGETTQFDKSDLKLNNSYYLNFEGSDDKIVDEYNVRGFLSHEKNQSVVKGFYAYLTGNPTMNEVYHSSGGNLFKASPSFKEIYYNDDKLASVFNDYYNNTVQRGVGTNEHYYENELTNLTDENFEYASKIIKDNYFSWNTRMYPKYLNYIPLDFNEHRRSNENREVIVKVPKGENYFINVFLQKTVSQTAREIFELYNNSNKINEDFTQIIPDFFNTKSSINNTFSNDNQIVVNELPYIEFENNQIKEYEGQKYVIKLFLSKPAVGGESFTVQWEFQDSHLNSSDFAYGIPDTFHKTFYLKKGQQYILLDPAKVTVDIYKTSSKKYTMKITDLLNMAKGNISEAEVIIMNTTQNRNISFRLNSESEIIDGINYALYKNLYYNGVEYAIGEFSESLIQQGTFFYINIALNEPSIYGIESFSLEFKNGTTYSESENNPDWDVWWWIYDDVTLGYSEPIFESLSGQSSSTANGKIDTGSTLSNLEAFKSISFLPGEQTKTLMFQFFSNEDANVGGEEYFDIEIKRLEFLDEGTYMKSRIYIQDYTIEDSNTGSTIGNV